jgi:YrbI family 3-deoxy-D-manno-octulosonate 8-phosphate phosphatase
MKIETRMQKIRLVLSDVDGVLTDGSITYDNQGIESKSFHVRDGMGIKLWRRAGHQFGVLTARTSHLVKMRMAEIGIDLVRQGVEEKLPAAMQIADQLEIDLQEICYIGDDLTDLRLMNAVGLAVSVVDGADDVRAAADLVTKTPGGKGAIRELLELILKSQKRWEELLRSFS